MNNKVRLDRLRELKFILENHSKLFSNVGFDMTKWFSDDCYVNEKVTCGTAACALGSAGLWPKFRRAGLITIDEGITYKGFGDYSAGSEFFGITYSESKYLFSPLEYQYKVDVKPSQVVSRVKELIIKYEGHAK